MDRQYNCPIHKGTEGYRLFKYAAVIGLQDSVVRVTLYLPSLQCMPVLVFEIKRDIV